MTTQTLTATQFPRSARAERRARRLPWTLLVLATLWICGVVLAARGPAPAEPVLLVLFGAGLIGAASLLPLRTARAVTADISVRPDGD